MSQQMTGMRGGRRPVATPSAESTERHGERGPERGHDYVALARALEARADEILGTCQARYRDALGALYADSLDRDPLWRITSIATLSIARWLRTGESSNDVERTEISSIGRAAAQQRARVAAALTETLEEPDATVAERARDGGDAEHDAAVGSPRLSVAMLTKMNLWWSDATCDVLTEEAARLRTPPSVLGEAKDMVFRSCRASLVGMAKRFDAEIASLHRRLTELALHDPLTGLPNRTLLIDQLDRAVARLGREPSGLALVFIDLDDFKTVNDVRGHACGDAVLAQVAARLQANVRAGDLVARLGGDEFVVLLEGLPKPAAEALQQAERIREVVAEPITADGRELQITASAGVATVREPGRRSEDVLAEADAAMYSAKRAGRNRVAAMESGDGPHRVRFATASGLHRALERRELRLEYQPVYGSRTGTVAGFEALLRWDHPDLGVVPPLEFVPIAEESGLMVGIGEWVLAEACRQAVKWSAVLGSMPRMAVNVSARQLDDREFVRRVADILEQTGMPAGCLTLEITETVLLGEGAGHEATLGLLKELGVQLAIDDFGTGYSSLAYLRRFPVDQLKVDRGFVRDVAEHGDTRIMGAVVRLAHELGLEVVAEGVETGVELDVVQRLGCDVVQGFLLGRPVPPELVDLAERPAAAIA